MKWPTPSQLVNPLLMFGIIGWGTVSITNEMIKKSMNAIVSRHQYEGFDSSYGVSIIIETRKDGSEDRTIRLTAMNTNKTPYHVTCRDDTRTPEFDRIYVDKTQYNTEAEIRFKDGKTTILPVSNYPDVKAPKMTPAELIQIKRLLTSSLENVAKNENNPFYRPEN